MNEKKKRFIRALAEYLAADAARKSIELQMGKESAKEWSHLYIEAGLSGWCTVEKAEAELIELLG